MAGTRSSARLANVSSSPNAKGEKSSPRAGSKRKADSQDSSPPKGKRGRKASKQQTIEETMLVDNTSTDDKPEDDQPKDIEMKEAADEGEGTDKPAGTLGDAGQEEASAPAPNGAAKANDEEPTEKPEESAKRPDPAEEEPSEAQAATETVPVTAATSATKGSKTDNNTEPKEQDASAAAVSEKNGPQKQTNVVGGTAARDANTAADGAVETTSDRSGDVPSNILEKGIIYFFTRGRVGIEDPESVKDLQRSYIVLRPIPKGGKIGQGAIQDEDAARLLALPKKVFPTSGKDRFMVFVEKSGASMKTLKEDFLQGSEYETKTVGTRQTHPVTPVGEGVYALTTTGRTSHLVYMLTIPKEIGEVQNDMGIKEKGSFVTSLKNPTVAGPANARLPQGPDYPKELLEEFGNRGWMPIHKVDYLEYANTQLLLIGESRDKFTKALEQTSADKKNDKETPQEELEKLEKEDEVRVEHLKGDDSVFEHLGISKKEYPDVATTW